MKPDFFGKNLFQLSYDKLEKGKDCSSSYDKGIVIDPLIKDSFLEVESRSDIKYINKQTNTLYMY